MPVAFFRSLTGTALAAMFALTLAACGGISATRPGPSQAAAQSPRPAVATTSALPTARPTPDQSATQPTIPAAAATMSIQPTAEQPVAPEQNPVGDIPDTQAFVAYTATTGGYGLDIPEGWARSTDGANVRFESKLDGLAVTVSQATAAPTVDSVRAHEAATLIAAGRAVEVTSIESVTLLPSGPAILVKSTANSNPDTVTNKQVRLEQNSYLFYHAGKLATLTLWAPLGADNVDQWNRIAASFHWS